MEKLRIYVTGADARVTFCDTITTGMVGATVNFSFDPIWDGLLKTAVFKAGNTVKDVLLASDTVKIPHEVLDRPVVLWVGVYGHTQNGTIVIPTVMAECCEIRRGANPSGDTSTTASLPIWAQLRAEIEDLKTKQGGQGNGGADVFVQPEEPEDAEVGTLWFDTDEEPENTEVLFVPQELTEDQKKQARANIGASDLGLVTIDLVSMGMPTLNMDTRETVSLETDTTAMKETADNNFVEYIVSAEYSGMIFNSIRIVVPPGGTVGTFAIGSILICVSILYSTDGNGVSACAFVTKELPGVTEEDNGKIVQVVNGKWQLATMPDTYNKTEIDTIMGAYIADIDTLIGGDS